MDTVLFIEDEIRTLDLLERYFQMVGYQVITTPTGRQGIALAIQHRPTVIVLDIMLPDTDGYEVARELRSDPRTDQIPILFLTQKDDRRDRLDGLELGVDGYITKPFDVEELRVRVHNIVTKLGGSTPLDVRTTLPRIDKIREDLPDLLADPELVFLDVGILHFDVFGEQYGPRAANQVIHGTTKLIVDLMHEVDPTRTYVGQPRDDHYLLAVPGWAVRRLERDLPVRFAALVTQYYDYPDQQRGHMLVGERPVPFMAFKLTNVPPSALRRLVKKQKRSGATGLFTGRRKPPTLPPPRAGS